MTRTIATPVLDIAYRQFGGDDGFPVVLLHGFPYDWASYDEAGPLVADAGARVIVPSLRGYGSTRFRSDSTMRSGQQAALGRDLLDLLDALDIERAVVGGYDWGGRAACVLAALHPERVAGLVSVDGYNIQQIAASGEPEPPDHERALWYQWYFQSERGRRGLARNRDDLCRILWQDWSPEWPDAAAAFELSAPSLHNPDFVDVVIHSYRHRYGNAPGDPAYEADERMLATRPPIAVPAIVLCGASDGLGAGDPDDDRADFTGPFRGAVLPGVGHNPPQEAPAAFAAAVASLLPAAA
ncbi:alpha/beta hydrolase [Herbiconiux daphne]|uniref:Alpha/beta hydrolase n=1 Tax=Herbiconiux daphne TaxID=2970914 RepID=A0ABT2H295_9MICO|nr:alpha/beta hydrolase [Herbiconiux daphne]MCS5734071.1 alpha/beta hydrolase [Herbiconiux daphne]